MLFNYKNNQLVNPVSILEYLRIFRSYVLAVNSLGRCFRSWTSLTENKLVSRVTNTILNLVFNSSVDVLCVKLVGRRKIFYHCSRACQHHSESIDYSKKLLNLIVHYGKNIFK